MDTESCSEFDSHGHRKFYDFEFIDENLHVLLNASAKDVEEVEEDSSKLIQHIRENIIGADYTFLSPFGLRKGKRFAVLVPNESGLCYCYFSSIFVVFLLLII